MRPFLRQGTVMRIISMGLLGDMFIELTPGTPGQPPLRSGELIASREHQDTLAQVPVLEEQVRTLLARANQLVLYAQSRDSSVGRLFRDDELYAQMVDAVKQLRLAAVRIGQVGQNVNETILDPQTKQEVRATMASVSRVAGVVQKFADKIDRVRFYLDAGMNKYGGTQFAGLADLRVVPNPDRYYMAGVEYFNLTNSATTDSNNGQYGLDAQLGFRALDTPLFLWGGLKRTYLAAGLNADLLGDRLALDATTYQFGRPTLQLDLGAQVHFLRSFALQAGADDALLAPMYYGGFTLTYNDEDLASVLMKFYTGL